MQLQRHSTGQRLTVDDAAPLGAGGEARIYVVQHDSTLVAKIYREPTQSRADKLGVMLANPPSDPTAASQHTSIAWPLDVLYTVDDTRRVVGFLMRRVSEMSPIIDVYLPITRRQQRPWFDYYRLHHTARNLAAAVQALHARGYVIGDVNESNVLVADNALLTLVDTDSFQVRALHNGVVYRCPVGKPEFTPPELQGQSFASVDRAPEHDLFGLAVLIFQLLMEGTHPFAGRFQGRGDPPPYEARIAAGHFPYGRRPVPYAPAATAPPFDVLHPTVQHLFIRCFEEGHSAPQARPDALTWRNTLDAAKDALSTCPSNTQHRYGSHLRACPWCERTARLGGRDPFPSQEAVRRRDHLRPVAQTRTQGQTAPPPTPTTPRPPRRFTAWGRLVALLLLAAVGGWWWMQSRTPGVVQEPASRTPPVQAPAPATPAPATPTPVTPAPGKDQMPGPALGEKTWRNSFGMDFVLIPAGKFMMGSDTGDSDEKPVHEVRLSKPFYLGTYEVTQGQWQAVMGNNPSNFKGDTNLPVENVSWNDVQDFVRKLNTKEGGTKYRLPTEAEWEYAARAGTTTAYSFGNDAGQLGEYAWYSTNAGNKTHPVGQKKPNPWGLHDMHGNVWEWVQDWSGPYTAGSAVDPAGPSSGSIRVHRGGSWFYGAGRCRSASRLRLTPGYRYVALGFRLLRTAE